MLKKLIALSTVVVAVVAMSSAAEAGKCRVKRARKCCKQRTCYTCPAPCNVCGTPAAAPAADAAVAEPAKEEAPAPPAEKK